MKKLDKNIDDKTMIKLVCKHNFIIDYVDLTPERSERIIYCTKCEQCAETLPGRKTIK